jgi:lysophospholipase L1-like esterase
LALKRIIAISFLLLSVFVFHPVALAEQSTSSWPSLTKHVLLPPDGSKADAFHMVVIGDSVAWGNGLNDPDKYYYIVADWLQKKLNRPVDVAVYAHSGATISGEIGKSIDPNLNSGYPTLMDQASNIQNKDEVDLILVSGGINDVGVLNIINPYISSDEIGQRAQSTKGSMEILLTYLLDKCKNARISVTNYYPIVSEDSDTELIMRAYDLGILAVDTVLNRDTLDGSTAKERLTENSAKFHEGSTTAITNAISDSDDTANRIVLANVNFKPENSYAASDTWLWKFIAPQASMVSILRTDDDQFDYRSSLASDPIDKINAVGHPNRDGAKEYARAIESAINLKGLDWLQNESAISQDANNTQESSQQVSSTASVESANQPRISWMKKGYGKHSETSTIQQTSDEGYIIASSAEWDDVRLIKTDLKGNVIWDKLFQGPEEANIGNTNEKAFSVRQMSDGGYNILASTEDVNGIFAWLIKTDSKGDIIWDKVVEEQARIISGRQTSDGEYIIGTFSSDENIGLSKIDSEGNKLWGKTFEETTFSDANLEHQLPVQQTKDGGYVIACNKGNNGTLLIKTDSQGNELWNKLFSPPEPSMELAYSVQQTSDGGYIIAGKESRLERDPYNDEIRNSYGALIKTDSSGNIVWNKTLDMYEDSNNDKWTYIEHVLQTDDGGYVLAGQARAEEGPSYNECTWVIKTDSSGNNEWDKRFPLFIGTTSSISSIQQTNDGGYILGGDSDFYGPWLVKIGGDEDVTDTGNNPTPSTDTLEQQENKSRKSQSGTQEETATSKAPGFGGILAIAALLCIFIRARV